MMVLFINDFDCVEYLLLNSRILDQNMREEEDLHGPIEKNRYHPNDYHDLCPFFSMLFQLIL